MLELPPPYQAYSLISIASPHSKTAAMTPAAKPPTVPSILPAPLLPVADGAGAAVPLEPEVGAAEELAAAVELIDAFGTSVALRVPHVLQAWEPGF